MTSPTAPSSTAQTPTPATETALLTITDCENLAQVLDRVRGSTKSFLQKTTDRQHGFEECLTGQPQTKTREDALRAFAGLEAFAIHLQEVTAKFKPFIEKPSEMEDWGKLSLETGAD